MAETIIERRAGWKAVNVRELWTHRELLFFLAWRDVKVRYKQTVLGVAWAVLQPVMMMAVFSLFLGRLAGLASGDVAYPLFVFAGLLPWFFFSTGMSNAANSVVESERLITKVYFPRLTIPFAAVAAALVDFCLALIVLAVLFPMYGSAPSWQVVLIPLPMFLIVLFAMGVGASLSALNVAYRDFRYVVPFMVQLWMFGTPSIYFDGTKISDSAVINWLIALNPMNGLIAFFRAALFGKDLPWLGLAQAAAIVVATFAVGCLYFRRVEASFADTI